MPARRKGGKKKTVELTLEEVVARMHMPLKEAADSLNVSKSGLKRACRLLGIVKWPRCRSRRFCAVDADADADASTPGGDEAGLSFDVEDVWFVGDA